MASAKRSLGLDHSGWGWIYSQIIFICAGPDATVLSLALCRPWLVVLVCSPLQWVYFSWLLREVLPCRGVHDSAVLGYFLLPVRIFPRRSGWDDVQHHHCGEDRVVPLHGCTFTAMSYFRLLAKKGATQLMFATRNQNVLHQVLLSVIYNLFEDLASQGLMIVGGPRFWTVARTIWAIMDFDSTLGYPGEGPPWSTVSANVDSCATNYNCMRWEADVFLLQEARVADSNLVESQRKAALCSRQLYCSQPLHTAHTVSPQVVQPLAPTKSSRSSSLRKMMSRDTGPIFALPLELQQLGTRSPRA